MWCRVKPCGVANQKAGYIQISKFVEKKTQEFSQEWLLSMDLYSKPSYVIDGHKRLNQSGD